MAYFNLFYKIDEIGKENIPKEGAYVLASNHIHWMDPLLYVCENKRMVYAVGKEELFSNKLKSFIMTRLGVFPIKRDGQGANFNSINKSIEKLKEGYLLLIYPEGTRMGLYKGVKPKKGVALFALQARVPIIPMAMVGTFKPFSKIRFIIGEPMDVSDYYSEEGKQPDARNIVTVSNKVMEKIVELRDSIQTPEIEEQMLLEEAKREKKKSLKMEKKEGKHERISGR